METLSRGLEPIPVVLLSDTQTDARGVPLVDPSSVEMPRPADRADRYQLFGEIARGGMGAVLKGRDPDLGRELAVKVLLESHKGKPELVRRFVEEAQIGGQLQHPGIVPIYELGVFADRRPFFAMKLVKGRTLAALLADRPDPARDLARFLSIFESACQTMAYAHARGVIHRDLKPSNVMVGSFGEVQVMDWGLAKILRRGGAADDASAGKDKVETVIATARAEDDTDQSRAGSVMGTPAYMAPEQARGEVDRLDGRCDVFALGSILCELLSGDPAFTGRSSAEILRRSARGDLAGAIARLEASGADPELIALAESCLAPEPEDRPRDAGEVAGLIGSYLAGVQERLHRSERERAVAESRAIEERKRRRLQVGLAACLLAVAALGGLGTAYVAQQRQARATTVAKLLGEATTLSHLARSLPDDPSRWQTALVAIRQAEGVVGGVGVPEALRQLATLRREMQVGADAADRDRRLLDRLVDIRGSKEDDEDGSGTDADYADAFREAGLDPISLPPEQAVAAIKARPAAVALAVASALDDWATMIRGHRQDGVRAKRLTDAARAADPDPWRNDLRAALDLTGKPNRLATLQALARSAKTDELGPISLNLLGAALSASNDPATAEAVLRPAQRRHPGDVWINANLAQALERLDRRDEAIRFYTAARSVRPEVAHDLAHALLAGGEKDEAIATFRELTRLRPRISQHWICLAELLKARGRPAEADAAIDAAITVAREAVRIKPDGLSHFRLGYALKARGRLGEAAAEFREASRLDPGQGATHNVLGTTLIALEKRDEALAEIREAIRLKPREDLYIGNLGRLLADLGKFDEAIAAHQEAIRLDPADPSHFHGLGLSCYRRGKFEDAISAYREALRLDPRNVDVHNALGAALFDGPMDYDAAVAEFREAIRIEPNRPDSASNLGQVLLKQGRFDGAIAAYREASRLDPNLGAPHCYIAMILKNRGDYLGSLAEFRRGHELGSKTPGWAYPSARWVREAERLAGLAERLPGIIRGEVTLGDDEERSEFAQMMHETKRYAAAARLWGEALAADPKLADDREDFRRYNAACAAALAAEGKGVDEPAPDEAARAALRRQALDWLRAERAARIKTLESNPPGDRSKVAGMMAHWKMDADLAGIRDPGSLAKLPDEERKAWRSFWEDVDALLKQAL